MPGRIVFALEDLEREITAIHPDASPVLVLNPEAFEAAESAIGSHFGVPMRINGSMLDPMFRVGGIMIVRRGA